MLWGFLSSSPSVNVAILLRSLGISVDICGLALCDEVASSAIIDFERIMVRVRLPDIVLYFRHVGRHCFVEDGLVGLGVHRNGSTAFFSYEVYTFKRLARVPINTTPNEGVKTADQILERNPSELLRMTQLLIST